MVRTLRILSVIHGLIVIVDLFLVTESGVYFLLDDSFHAAGKFVGHGIQKCLFGLLLFFTEVAHGDLLLEEPDVDFSELAQFDIHVALVDDVEHEVAEALVELCAVLVGVARLANDFKLGFIWASVDHNFLLVEVECRQTEYQLFIHGIILEFRVLEHLHRDLVVE